MTSFKIGELLIARVSLSETTVWNGDLDNSVDSLHQRDVATVLEEEDSYGWVWILTPRGIQGLVHKTNLKRL